MRKQKYTFRADCVHDVTKFMEKAKFWYSIEVDRCVIEKTVMPHVIAEITTKESIHKIVSIFKKIPNSNTMIQTIQPSHLFTCLPVK